MPYILFEDPENNHQESIPGPAKPVNQVPPAKTSATMIDTPCKYPIVRLDVERITDSMSSRLATSLLGHVLFLKNQVPFPMMQLARIPTEKTNARATKLRAELIASYDTISSHFDTTFSALSTAIARGSPQTKTTAARAYLAFLVGPSMGSAKTKVILGIHGLETRIWGARDDVPPSNREVVTSHEERPESDDDDCHESDGNDGESESTGNDSDGGTGSGDEPESSEQEEDTSDEEEEEEAQDDNPFISHAEEQKFLLQAERLLSRTLAAADAEGRGISSELTPTQVHVLIRAPRRFSHPSWIPRQNITHSLDLILNEFIDGSGADASQEPVSVDTRGKKGKHVEGVWIAPRDGLASETLPDLRKETSTSDEDDMIWWSWDGKLCGFSDW